MLYLGRECCPKVKSYEELMLAAEVAFVAISQLWPPLSSTARTREAVRYLGALVVM